MSAPHPPLLVLQAALDRRLSEDHRVEVDAHVAACGTCRRHVHILRWTRVRLGGLTSAVAVPPMLDAELHRALAEAAAPLAPAATPSAAAVAHRWWHRVARWRGGA